MGQRQRGFTLMELMVAVAIVGILATIAMFAYNKYIKTARSSAEVPAVLAEFQLRENQFAVENGGFFLSTGANENDKWPPTPSGSKTTTSIAGGPQNCAPAPGGPWCRLHITLDKPGLYCAYVAIAGVGRNAAGIGPIANQFGLTAGTVPVRNWYYIVAECDWDDDNTSNELWFVRSDVNGRQVLNKSN